ncbi:NBS-LRR resistance-like protein [Gossypium australe]|uniref:NBS-LRR resistance-like protein n=1 Tax=Gossypium australe TaxID=47621 RepID=A0A5B6VA67_9ROSI|nr:NBS-LRR resistance-like protein [Gossypium australe]
MQEGEVVVYASRQLNIHKRNYPTHNFKLAAVVFGDTTFMARNVSSILATKSLKWIELLKNYDCVIKYHLGRANMVADALSRKSLS